MYLGGNMSYIEIVVMYDIVNNKKRYKLYEELKDMGLKPIQKSVFWGYVLPNERRNIIELYDKYCDKETDKVIVLNAQLKANIQDCFGYLADEFKYPRKYEIL